MALSFQEQYEVGIRALQFGDLDLFSKLLTDPNTVTIEDQRTVAQRLGIKGGLLSTLVNTAGDPTVWLAFLMQRSFPITAWNKGLIPSRFIGTSNEFSGMSFFTRPIEGFFRGSHVPKMVALTEHRKAEVRRALMDRFQKVQENPVWQQDHDMISLLREGQHVPGATQEHYRLRNEIADIMDGAWGFLSQTQEIKGGFGSRNITKAVAQEFPATRAPIYQRDFLPHLVATGPESVIEINGREALQKLLNKKGASQSLQITGENIKDVWRVDKQGNLSSNFDRVQEFLNRVGPQVFNPSLFRRRRQGILLESAKGKELFVTDLNVAIPMYIDRVARTYALNAPLTSHERTITAAHFADDVTGRVMSDVPTSEPPIVQMVNRGLELTGARFTRREFNRGTPERPIIDVEERLIPSSVRGPSFIALKDLIKSVKGTMGEDQILMGNMFANVAGRFDRWASVNGLSKKQINEATMAMDAYRRNQSQRQVENSLTSLTYASTLGLNFGSVIQQLTQTPLTTSNVIGLGSTMAGVHALTNRIPAYARNAIAEHRAMRGTGRPTTARFNEAMERSFNRTFPELAEQGISLDPRAFEIDPDALRNVQDVGGQRRTLFRNLDSFNKILLQPFTQGELVNRVVAFYGGKHHLQKSLRTGELDVPLNVNTGQPISGKELDDFLNFSASEIVSSTQLVPGAGSRTIIQSRLPGPLRQFQSFPTRLFNYFTESTVRGAMTQKQLEQASIFRALDTGLEGQLGRQKLFSLGTGRNVGTLARTYILSNILVRGARDALGVDLGNALGILSPFNIGEDYYPIPIPPIPRAVYGLYSAASTRDVRELQPLTLPGVGDVPIPKVLVPGGVAFSRAARAYNQFRPDMGGFVDNNERLMDRADSMDLALTMFGVPLDKGRRLRNVMERTRANRFAIRDFRRRYASAILGSDFDQANSIRKQYSDAFPDMPELSVSAKDLRRYQQNAMIPAVQRMINTLGSSGNFLERQIYDYDPELLAPQGPLEFLPQLN